MPINIYEDLATEPREIAWLCSDDWELPNQIQALREWMASEGHKLPASSYVADIGFTTRPDAAGGGGVMCLEMMKNLCGIGMEVYLSEYPSDDQ